MVLKIIGSALILVVFLVGVLFTACMLAELFDAAVNRFMRWKRSQYKIRWLCDHEYTEDYSWECYGGYTEYYLVCRKCGKEKRIDIYDAYDDEDEEDEDA